MSTAQEKDRLADRMEMEVGSESRQLFEKLAAQWRIVAAAVAGVLLLAAAYGGYGAYQERRLARAEAALSEALLASQGAERIAALDNLRGDLPASLLPRFWLESARAAQEQGDWTKALEFWKKLADDGPEQWKVLGRLGASSALLELNRPDDASAELERLRAEVGAELLLTVMLQQAEAAEMAENWERAAALYEELKAKDETSRSGYLDFKINELRDRLAAQQS